MAGAGLAGPHSQVVATGLDGVYFPMAFERHPLAFEPLRQLLHQVHRTVLATRTTDGNGDVAAMVAGKCIKPIFQKMGDVVLHQGHQFLCLQKLDDGLITPG